MCHNWKLKALNELSLEEIEKLFSSKSLSQISVLNICGGEPFIRKDMSKVINLACKLPKLKEIRIVSNGFHTERILETMKKVVGENKIKFGIKISLDGLEKTHDKLRKKGSFNKAVNTIKELSKLDKGLHVWIGTTMLQENLNEIIGLFELSKKLGVEFFVKPALNGEQYNNNEIIFDLDRERAINLLKRIKNDYCSQERRFSLLVNRIRNTITREFYKSSIEQLEIGRASVPCYAGFGSVIISSTGDVHPCVKTKIKFGNIRKKSFDEIWNSRKADRVRKNIKNNQCKSCFATCDLIPSLICSRSWSILKNSFFEV